MNKFRATGITLIALSMGLGQLAMAQGRGDDRGDDRRGGRGDRGAERGGPPERGGALRPDGSSRWDGHGGDRMQGRGDDRRADFYRDGRHDNRPFYREAPRYDHSPRPVYGAGPHRGEWRGAGPRHAWHRGGYLPPQYRSRGYVVDDWRGHRLSAPPRGYHWVQAGGDYVLAAIATGVILQILLSN
jgi:Ni/Co efflux regulator RcnB